MSEQEGPSAEGFHVPDASQVVAKFYYITSGWTVRERSTLMGISQTRAHRINHGSALYADEYVQCCRIIERYMKGEETIDVSKKKYKQRAKAMKHLMDPLDLEKQRIWEEENGHVCN